MCALCEIQTKDQLMGQLPLSEKRYEGLSVAYKINYKFYITNLHYKFTLQMRGPAGSHFSSNHKKEVDRS